MGGVLVGGGGGRWLGWLLEARSQELGRSLAHDKVPARSSLTYPRHVITYLEASITRNSRDSSTWFA